ncbi:MAG TPA: TlpA disulfide reductase family protein [Anaeromyxobacteraceae bacterium]|nr:TlpA disulfide reductase family protein [Anaeromyxobacteraceae bacterium]
MSTIPRSLLLLAALAGGPEAAAFTYLEVGEPVEDVEMPTLDGRRERLLGKGKASLFVFFRPGQDHSLDVLARLAKLEREFAGKPVHFAAVVGDDSPAADVRAAVKEAGIRMPVLLDRGNAFYGKLGVRLHPVVGIADQGGRLAAYEHFRKVNMEDRMRVRLRRLLGEITDAQVEAVLEPARAEEGGPAQVARRYNNLARALLKGKNHAKAEETARKSLQADASLAAAHGALGAALAGLGKCAEALPELEIALRADPADAAALEGKKTCGK